MRQSLLAAVMMLAVAAPGATTMAGQTPPAQKPQTPPPATPAPAPPPPAQAAPAPQPPRPFPEGAKIAYFNIQMIANASAEGKAATTRVKALNDKKVTELNDKNKQLQTAEQKLQKEGGVMSDSARSQLEKEVDRLQKEIQRFTQDAQADVQELQNELQREFQRKLLPIVGQVGAEKGLHMIFSVEESGIVWADTGLDMTPEIIKRLDAAAAKPAAK